VSALNDGGPAFPSIMGHRNTNDNYCPVDSVPGLSLRDYFAAKAMQGFAADPNCDATAENMAEAAYRWADAMLAEREKQVQNGAADLKSAALACLDANGHLRGCEAGEGTDGNEDHCTNYCAALRKAVAKAEGR
jgi:hypothetical protein